MFFRVIFFGFLVVFTPLTLQMFLKMHVARSNSANLQYIFSSKHPVWEWEQEGRKWGYSLLNKKKMFRPEAAGEIVSKANSSKPLP